MTKNPGFTLLELLVAAAISAGLSVILTSAIGSLLSTYSDRNRSIAYVAAVQSATTRINSLISSADYVAVKPLYAQNGTVDSAVVMREPTTASSPSQEFDLLCNQPNPSGELNLILFSVQLPVGTQKDLIDKVISYIDSCNEQTVRLVIQGGIPGVSLSTFRRDLLFDSSFGAHVIHFSAWPVWSNADSQDYSKNNPPAVRYQIVGSYNESSSRSSTRQNMVPAVYQTTVLTAFATSNGLRKVGP